MPVWDGYDQVTNLVMFLPTRSYGCYGRIIY
uniref:Uncharacterized protein n=1 Tax=Arundo donax TaxID=35708 RepID=A0A0A9B3Z5_ARUDO